MAEDGAMTTRRLAAALVAVLLLAGCSGDDAKPRAAASPTSQQAVTSSASAAPSGASSSASAGTTAEPTATAVPAPGTTTTGLPSRTSPTPVSSAPPGPQARRLSAAPGRYTLDATTSTGAGAEPEKGEATLTVDPPTGDDQHSVLDLGEYGSTEQTVRFSASAVELVQLKVTSGFTKEFRPVRPVLLLPQPPTVGRTWSWRMVSTDGATTASVEAKVTKTETIAVGGERVSCVVVHSTLRLTGDITATSVMDTWYADRYHVTVKQHAVTDGMLGTFRFHTDTTTMLRSTTPS
jgi:outer membrane murein-binding lipoprotein Lpp